MTCEIASMRLCWMLVMCVLEELLAYSLHQAKPSHSQSMATTGSPCTTSTNEFYNRSSFVPRALMLVRLGKSNCAIGCGRICRHILKQATL